MNDYPYKSIEVAWKRPPIDCEILRACAKRSDLQGLWHSPGTLAILELSGALTHGTAFKTKWLNRLFERIFGFVQWNSNSTLYKMSHMYTLHRQSAGEEVRLLVIEAARPFD